MRTLRLDLFQQTACYRKPFAIKISETYPLPQYSTVNGLMHKLLDANSYVPLKISIQGDYECIINDYQTTYFYKKNSITTMPMNQHSLLNVKLIVHINAEDAVLDLIYDKIKNLDEFLSLGRREDLLRIDDVRFVEVKEYEVDIDSEDDEEGIISSYVLKYPVYIPRRYDLKLPGINYRLNSFYTDSRRIWNKTDVVFVDKGNQIVEGNIYLDEKMDIVFFNNL